MGPRMSASCDMLQATVKSPLPERLSQFAWYRSLTVNRRVLNLPSVVRGVSKAQTATFGRKCSIHKCDEDRNVTERAKLCLLLM
jgi:hypothetical protein